MNAKSLNLLLLAFLLLFGLMFSPESKAVEITLFGGSWNHTAISGCCQNGGSQLGAGLVGRFQFQELGEIEFLGFSSGKWNQGLVLKPFYIIGRPHLMDPATGDTISSQTISNFRWISSLGGGFFTHTTRTKDFDLPTLVNGAALTNFNQFTFAINDRWSAVGIIELTVGLSRSTNSFISAGYLGAAYNFK